MFERRSLAPTISTRIGIAFAAFAGLLILLEICAAIGLLAGNRRFLNFSGIANVAERVATVSHDVVGMDRLAERYAGTGGDADLQQAREFAASIGTSLAALAADEYAAEVKDDLRRMQALLAVYSLNMQKMAEVRAERENLVNWKLSGIGVKARASLMQIVHRAAASGDTATAASAGLADDYLQRGRLNVYKFLAVPSAQLADAVYSQIDAFIASCEGRASTAQSSAPKALAAEVCEQGREYKATFAQVAASTATMTSLVKDSLAKYGDEIRNIAGKISASRRQNMNDEREASIADTARTMGLFITAALLAIAAEVLIALWIARAVVLPVHALCETFIRLSSGNTAVTVEGTRRQDEIGMLARALDRFRLSIISEVQAQRTLRMENEARCAQCKSGQPGPASTGERQPNSKKGHEPSPGVD
jgi:nitrogen fixation/metabolism regulation signal transduction histidine kinase